MAKFRLRALSTEVMSLNIVPARENQEWLIHSLLISFPFLLLNNATKQ